MSADFELAQRALAGDQDAFAELYDASYGMVYRKLLSMVRGDHDRAEDLTQDTFIKAFRKLHLFRGQARFTTWVYRIAFNEFLMYRRNGRRERETSVGSLDDHSSELMAHIREQTGYRDLSLAAVEDRLAIEQNVEKLSETLKTAFIVHDVLEYTHEEVRQLTGRPVGTSKTSVHRARKQLRALLQGKPVTKIPLAREVVPAVFSDSCELEPKP
jgi:RNA polymerase sigma-70 factor (ECF subfamily)